MFTIKVIDADDHVRLYLAKDVVAVPHPTGGMDMVSWVDPDGGTHALETSRGCQATIFVMPSVPSSIGTDGLPTVIIEAMALRIPVIGSNHAEIPEAIKQRETGLLVDPEDSESLAASILELLRDDELCQYLSQNGRRLVETEFSLKENVSVLVQLISESIDLPRTLSH